MIDLLLLAPCVYWSCGRKIEWTLIVLVREDLLAAEGRDLRCEFRVPACEAFVLESGSSIAMNNCNET